MPYGGSDQRLTGLRAQWGITGVARPFAGACTVIDATAQNASRLAVTFDLPAAEWDGLKADLVVSSAVESGIWQRTFKLYAYGVCVAVPQGRVIASIRNHGPNPVPFRSTFGEGAVSREWQTVESGLMPAGDKRTLIAPPYARRVMVRCIVGGPYTVSTDTFPGVAAVVSLLALPGGQTEFQSWAPTTLKLSNDGAGDSVASVEWEVLG